MRNLVLAAVLLSFLLTHATYGREPVTLSIRSLLFEVVENGSLSRQRASVDIDAACNENGDVSAEVRFAYFSIYPDIHYVLMNQFCASTAVGSVRHLQIDPSSLTLERSG